MRYLDKLLSWQKKSELVEELQDLEKILHENLIPVDPRPQFVNDLRRALLRQFINAEISPSRQHKILHTGLLVTSGILGSIVVIITGIRGVVSLVGVVGLVISWFKQNSHSSVAPSRPSN